MELKAIKIQELDEKGWKDYFYLAKNRTLENTDAGEWREFKKERLEQYESTPVEFKVEECLLIYDGDPFAWIACSLKGKNSFFIFDTNLEELSDDIIKALLTKIYELILSNGKDTAYFWSKNSATSDKLKIFGAILMEETEEEPTCSQFNLTKKFLEKYSK